MGGVIEVQSTLNALLQGSLTLTVGSPTESILPFSDWIVALTKINATATDEGYIDQFFSASANFEGDVSATVSLLEPFSFDGMPTPSFTGTLDTFAIDFFAYEKPKPTFDLTIDGLPNIGNVKDLSFSDVIDILGSALEFLVGDPDVDDVTTCSGGLLGTEISGQNVFTYQLPGKFDRLF